MSRTMADSITATDIPPGRFALVAGYIDGAYKWTDADWIFHHASRLVRITVTGATLDADVADVENGDLTPDQGAAWVKQMLGAGKRPCLYFSASQNAAIDAAVAAHGVGPDDGWLKWTANWTGVAPAAPFGVAEQYANPAYTGAHYDLSVVADLWPGVDVGPAPGPVADNLTGVLAGHTAAEWDYVIANSTWEGILSVYGPAIRDALYARAHPPPPLPVPPPPPLPVPPPPPIPGPPIDQARSAWANEADFLTHTLPDTIAELLRLLGLLRRTP